MTKSSEEDLFQAIRDLIDDQLQVVTYKWLAREYMLSAAAAQKLLSTFADAHKGKVSVTYMLSGFRTSHPPDDGEDGDGRASLRSHAVQLVSADRLDDRLGQLDKDSCHVQVYSLQPTQPKDTADLWNRDQQQLEAAFDRLLSAPQTEARNSSFGCGGLSSIECGAATRGNARPPRKPQAPPTPVSIEPLRRAGAIASAPGAVANSGMSALWKKQPPAKFKAKTGPKVAAKSKTKSDAPAKPVNQVSDGASSDEEEDAIAAANRGRLRNASRFKGLASDSEDDEMAATPGLAPGGAVVATGFVDTSSAAVVDQKPSVAVPSQVAPATLPDKDDSNPGNSKRRKVTKTVFDKKGEETTVTVWEDVPSPSPAAEVEKSSCVRAASIANPPAVSEVPVAGAHLSNVEPAVRASPAGSNVTADPCNSEASDGAAMARPPAASTMRNNSGDTVLKPKNGSRSGKTSGGAGAKKVSGNKAKPKNQQGIASFFTKK